MCNVCGEYTVIVIKSISGHLQVRRVYYSTLHEARALECKLFQACGYMS